MENSGYPQNKFRHGCLLWKLYERMKQGPITTNDLAKIGGHSHSRRITDIDKFLTPDGFMVKSRPIGNHGNGFEYEYSIKKIPTDLWEAVG